MATNALYNSIIILAVLPYHSYDAINYIGTCLLWSINSQSAFGYPTNSLSDELLLIFITFPSDRTTIIMDRNQLDYSTTVYSTFTSTILIGLILKLGNSNSSDINTNQ